MFNKNSGKQKKYIVFGEYFEEVTVKELQKIADRHWREFELFVE